MTGQGPARTPVQWLLFPFWNDAERRPRALWRLVAAVFVLALLFRVVIAAGLPVNGLGFRATVVRTAVVVAAILLATWFADRRGLAHLGLTLDRRWLADFVFGGVLGVAVIALGVGVLSPLGWMDPDLVSRPDLRGIVIMVGTLLFASLLEEVAFRSWLLRVVAEGFNSRWIGPRGALWIGTAVSSILFALLHGGNPNVTTLALVNIAAAGVFLALPYLWTGRLGLSWGLHWTWNVAQGPIFGIPVSGVANMPSLVITRETGPDTITGGTFGIEGGLSALVLILVAIVLTAAWVWRRQGAVVPDAALLDPAGPARVG